MAKRMGETKHPVLIVGGSGQVGARAAAFLRRLQPALPIAIGGRDLAKAFAVASEVGGAEAVVIDLSRPDLGQAGAKQYSAVAVFLKDEALEVLHFAQGRSLPYVGVSSGLLEIGPEVSAFVHRPRSAPMLLASHCLAGAAVLVALHRARDFQRVDAIRASVLLDDQDMGGPAAVTDFERLMKVSTAGLVRRDRAFVWLSGDDARSTVRSVDGTELDGQSIAVLDVLSLAEATGAPSIRFDMAVGETASRRRGEPCSTEVAITLEGIAKDGRRLEAHCELVHPEGQRSLTALAVALAIERLLGLEGGEPVAPGLYSPEVILDPAYVVRRFQEFGARYTER